MSSAKTGQYCWIFETGLSGSVHNHGDHSWQTLDAGWGNLSDDPAAVLWHSSTDRCWGIEWTWEGQKEREKESSREPGHLKQTFQYSHPQHIHQSYIQPETGTQIHRRLHRHTDMQTDGKQRERERKREKETVTGRSRCDDCYMIILLTVVTSVRASHKHTDRERIRTQRMLWPSSTRTLDMVRHCQQLASQNLRALRADDAPMCHRKHFTDLGAGGGVLRSTRKLVDAGGGVGTANESEGRGIGINTKRRTETACWTAAS